MFTRELTLAGFLMAACTMAQAQTETSASATADPRTAAALPEPIGDFEEPMPPSPVVEAAAGEATPGLDADFGIGQPATAEEIAAIDIDIMPDGSGLPEGSGTYAEGETIYAEQCASCHGDNLEGIKETGAPALIGGRGSLATDKPLKTVESYWPHASTLFDYIHRAMPLHAPGSLSADEVYAVSAYILGRGGILPEDAELDAQSFREIEMPNADGFVKDPRPDAM